MDSYSRFWNPWYQLFNLHCKNHGPIIFLSEDKEPDFINDVTHIKTGAGEWGERLLRALKQIDSELVFYMQEDFWCVNDYELTDQLLEMFEKHGMDQLHIKENTPLISTKKITGNLYRFEQKSEYTQNHQFLPYNLYFNSTRCHLEYSKRTTYCFYDISCNCFRNRFFCSMVDTF